MNYFIVFAGKGGTGKSTLAALTVRYLSENKAHSVLVVDADPNFCLPELLGVRVNETLASIRDHAMQNKPEGISLDEWLEIQINRIMAESQGFDLLVMGRPEGSGCYCAVNNILRRILQEISEQYRYIVVDNEAGMEHISRGIVNKIDFLFIVSSPSKTSMQAATRINNLVNEVGIMPKNKALIINQAFNEVEEDELTKQFGKIRYVFFDENLRKLSERGESIFSLSHTSETLKNFYAILEDAIG
ncbi:AAA family ATPase [Thermodesulfovibrio thiophilus]|uniref:AAA family ATPase n=1 Tax=Thermodesulfovibrio thiophilus TaxID=340095 RepID=UPI0003F6A62A|nr:ArsA-related P-loop ATPase [Thermodesulfovibrio thiophilus]